MNIYYLTIAVIEHSKNKLSIFHVPETFGHEDIENFLLDKKIDVSNTSWGEIDGIINDFRTEE